MAVIVSKSEKSTIIVWQNKKYVINQSAVGYLDIFVLDVMKNDILTEELEIQLRIPAGTKSEEFSKRERNTRKDK